MSTALSWGASTPIGKLSGALASLSTPDFGGRGIAGAIERGGVSTDTLDTAIMGTVVQAGVGANPARQAAVAAGLSMNVPATTVNSLCLPGVRPSSSADRLIATGAAVVVAAASLLPSQLSDGAAVVVVVRKDFAEARGVEWIAELRGLALVAGPDTCLSAPARECDRGGAKA